MGCCESDEEEPTKALLSPSHPNLQAPVSYSSNSPSVPTFQPPPKQFAPVTLNSLLKDPAPINSLPNFTSTSLPNSFAGDSDQLAKLDAILATATKDFIYIADENEEPTFDLDMMQDRYDYYKTSFLGDQSLLGQLPLDILHQQLKSTGLHDYMVVHAQTKNDKNLESIAFQGLKSIESMKIRDVGPLFLTFDQVDPSQV